MKKLLLMLASLLVVVALVGLIVPFFIPESAFKQPVVNQLQKLAGRSIAVNGHMRIKLFPFAGVYFEDVVVAGFPESPAAPLMRIASLNVEVETLPLLTSRQVIVKDVTIKNPDIHLQVNKDGRSNWLNAPTPQRGPAPPPPGPAASPILAPAAILLNNVAISGGTVSYQNDMNKQHWSMNKLEVDSSLPGMNEPFASKVSGEWNGKPIKISTEISSMQALMNHQAIKIKAGVKSDLLSFDANGVMENDVFAGKLAAKSSSLKAALPWLMPGQSLPIAAPLALSLSGDAKCSAEACSLTGADLTLDKLAAKGDVKAIFTHDVPSVDITLTTDALDLNPFLESDKKPRASLLISEALAETSWSNAPIDFSVLSALDLSANITTGSLLVNHLKVGKALIRAKLAHGKLAADMIDAELYSGKGNLMLSADSSGAVELQTVLRGIKAAPLMKDLMNDERISGTVDSQLTVSGRGKTQRDIISTMQGSGQFKMTDGSIRGVKLLDMMRNVTSAFGAPSGSGEKTEFSELSGTFTVAQGVVSNNDLAMNLSGINVSGKGQVNLPVQTINYRLTPQVVRGTGDAAKQGLAVPVIIEGNLDNPKFRPDVGAVVTDYLKDPKKFREEFKNSKGSLKDQLKGAKDLLKGFR